MPIRVTVRNTVFLIGHSKVIQKFIPEQFY